MRDLAAELALIQSEGGLASDVALTSNTGSWRIVHAASPTAKVPPDWSLITGLTPDAALASNTGSWRITHGGSPTSKVTPDFIWKHL